MRRRAFIAAVGGGAVWPLVASSQQKATAAIGYLHSGLFETSATDSVAFRRGLTETGYVEGQNLTIEYRWAEGRYDRLPALATELVKRKVDVIAAIGGPPAAHAAKNATSTIPIVFVTGRDPVLDGLVASLARPGGNLTGISFFVADLNPKRLELLRELVPEATAMAMLFNSDMSNQRELRELQEAAQAKGVQLDLLNARTESEIDVAFASAVQRQAGALVVAAEPFFHNRREQLVNLAARHAVPMISGFRDFATAGGLLSYGPSLEIVSRQAGIYAGKLLKGSRPADLPILQPTDFELVINLKTAKALGITIPPLLLGRADEVIE